MEQTYQTTVQSSHTKGEFMYWQNKMFSGHAVLWRLEYQTNLQVRKRLFDWFLIINMYGAIVFMTDCASLYLRK